MEALAGALTDRAVTAGFFVVFDPVHSKQFLPRHSAIEGAVAQWGDAEHELVD